MNSIPATQPFSYLVWTYAWTVNDLRDIPHMVFEEMVAQYDLESNDDLFFVDEIRWDGKIILKQPIIPILH